jgi:uncharacterized protein YndB with AHSA1/START domain
VNGDAARVSVSVAVPPQFAFRLFTEDIDRWWRHGRKFRHSAAASSVIHIEPKLGGRVFERFEAQGAAQLFEMGRIEVWEPPHRLGFTWRIANFAAGEQTRVDVEFSPSATGTLVTVTHSGFAALRPDHPVRHGLPAAQFVRMMGLWWGEQLTSLRMLCQPRAP